MECKNCLSKWELSRSASRIVKACPFCGTSLSDDIEGSLNVFDNSKDALACIARVHGVDVLLGGSLKSLFADYAPSVVRLRKNVIFSVYTSGAASIIKGKISAKASEQEIAFKQAVQKVIDTFGTELGLAESVIREFTDALGWEISVQKTQAEPVHNPQHAQAKQQLDSIQPPATIPKTPSSPKKEKLVVGQRNVSFGRIKWRVLDVQDGRALLLAEDIIGNSCYHNADEYTTWERCGLRAILNGTFLQNFSSVEQNQIVPVTNINADNQWFDTPGGRDTIDKVFLLSIDEAVKYFGDSGRLTALSKQPRKVFSVDSINDEFSPGRIAKIDGVRGWWWLRSPGMNKQYAALIGKKGDIDLFGWNVFLVDGNVSNKSKKLAGVRPSLWLNQTD